MDGMGNLDAPMPPMDAEQGMPMDDPNAMGTEQAPVDMPDPNADSMTGGQNMGDDDISSKYQQLSPDQQKAADKYVDSMLNTESKNIIRKAIDETFSSILDDDKEGTKRPQKKLENGLKRNLNCPYIPYE